MESDLSKVAWQAVLFDIDGTMCNSDPFHHMAFSELLEKVGFNGGKPITVEFGMKNLAGKTNQQIGQILFPDWDQEKQLNFFQEKEALFAKLAKERLKEIKGLHKLCEWVRDKGLKRAAVTNAPRYNAELMISILGLSDFFELIVTGEECENPKPSPDPYLKAVKELDLDPKRTLVFEDSVTGIKAGVTAGLTVIGIGSERREKSLLEAGASFCIRDFEDEKLWFELQKLYLNKL